MKRKLVKQGAATLMISLPSKWIKEHELGKGAEVNVASSGEALLITPESLSTQTKKETTIDLVSNVESSVRTLISTAYRRGFDRITVRFANEEQFALLQDTIATKLIGFDIIKKEKEYCVVENITEPSADQFDPILQKVFFNIDILFDITKLRLQGKEGEESYAAVEERIMKYDNFCRRIVVKERLLRDRAEFFWAFLHLIDHGHRELYHLNKAIPKPIKARKEVIALLEDARELFHAVRDTYLKKNIALLAKAHALEKDLLYKRGYELLETAKGKETVVLYHLLASVRKFFQTNSPLSGVLL
ncbi:MAG: phosphate uptake regulator PhoU [Candidatus Woesearchaeota archaeon]|nr:MAG: phosphate uptake regulator PhoU [Candidatus Woesearchaeota archaeon]